MDIFELLKRDHETVRQLLDQIEHAGADREREQLFARLVTEVEAHSQAEDDVFYTSIEGLADLGDKIDEARQEHDQVEALLEELDGLPAGADDWLDKVREIRAMIRHHVDEEENQIFPLARQHLGAQEAVRLGRELRMARNMATEELSSDRLVVDFSDTSPTEWSPHDNRSQGVAPLASDTTADERADFAQADASEDVERMSKRELYELARRRHLEGRSAMSKAELVEALRSAK
jgi:hemerythrin-like domain-containing protein